MRQASWEDMFKEGEKRPPKEPPWSRIAVISWEEIVTFVIAMIAMLTVVQSIHSAHWVPEMPSLYTIAFVGLAVGLILSRIHINEILAHLIGLGVGVLGILLTVSGEAGGGTLPHQASQVISRLHIWVSALVNGGISNDNLPFVVFIVASTYLAAYIAAWGVFRWYNAWLGLIPGGLVLLTNISYLPGQHSLALLVYIFCSILLVARVNLLRHERDWRERRTGYPDMISLHVLNVTIWVAIALLAFAWVLPVGNGSGAMYSLWAKVTSPISGPFTDLSRLFTSVDSKKGGTFHSFGSTLPLQGSINLSDSKVMLVTTTEPGFLRAQTYDFYTAQGWKIGGNTQITGVWPALKGLQSPEEARKELRRPVSIQVVTSRKTGVIVSDGEPLAVNIDSRVVLGLDQSDVTALRPTKQLNSGTTYQVDSTISNASVERLKAAPSSYPIWVAPYQQLPSDLPVDIGRKAREVTAGATNDYDKAAAIEQYLRTFAVDTQIKPAPPNKDSVEYFLFTLGRGYFDYHASAMVVMLRTLNIPARLAVGYTVRAQDRVPDSNVYQITDANSFAWPEVYFAGLGWVEFNPTPSEPRIGRTGTDALGGTSDTQDEGDDDTTIGGAAPATTAPAAPAIDQLQVKQSSHVVSHIIIAVILAVLAVSLLGGSIFQYAWQRGLGHLDYPMQIWEKTMRLAGWAHIRPLPQETPREVVARLQRALPEVADLDYLGDSYIRSRFGHKELQASEKERLTAVWNKTRGTLLGRLLRWR